MKLIVLILIAATAFAAVFEQGSVLTTNIEAHQIYKQVFIDFIQDVKFNSKFSEIPKIVLSIAGYQSKQNTLDFFSRVTEVTDQGFQLQVISDAPIESANFNFLATDHKEIQTICNNIEVTRDQIDIKFKEAYQNIPIAAAFLTGIHRTSEDNIMLEVKQVENQQAHIFTVAKAQSSIGVCLLVGPETVFARKELPIMQISQGLPNNMFFGISSFIGVATAGIQLNLNKENVENSFELGLTIIEINQSEITQQEEENQAVSFDDLVNKLKPQDQPQQDDIFQQEGQLKINSIQIGQELEKVEENTQINSISFLVPEEKGTLYIEDDQTDQAMEDSSEMEVMTLNKTWLQHDISVMNSVDSTIEQNQVGVQEGQQLLTNLIKPADYNQNSIEENVSSSQNIYPENVAVVDSTNEIIQSNSDNQTNQDSQFDEYQEGQAIENDNEKDINFSVGNISQDNSEESSQQPISNETAKNQQDNLEDQIENQIEEQIEQTEQTNVVEDLQEKVENIEQQIQTISAETQQSNTIPQLDALKIIEEQQFIVMQQKSIVEQQQMIIQQYQHMLEDKNNSEKIEQHQSITKNTNIDSTVNISHQEQQLLPENEKQDKIDDQVDHQNTIEDVKKEEQIEDHKEETIKDNNNSMTIQQTVNDGVKTEDTLQKDLETFNRLKTKKDVVNEKEVSQMLNSITKDLNKEEDIDSKMKSLENGLVNVLNKRSNEIEQDILVNDSTISSKRKVEYSNSIQPDNNLSMKQQQLIVESAQKDFSDVEAEYISIEEISETIFPKQYEMDQAYFDWSLTAGLPLEANLQRKEYSNILLEQNQEDSKSNQSQESSDELQKQIDTFLELDSNASSYSDPLFDDFHSFFSVNQQVRSNLRKRKVLNV